MPTGDTHRMSGRRILIDMAVQEIAHETAAFLRLNPMGILRSWRNLRDDSLFAREIRQRFRRLSQDRSCSRLRAQSRHSTATPTSANI
jgi:hypothetical protein